MARFFQDLEDEKQQVKKKIGKYTESSTEHPAESKKDRRVQEIKRLVSEAEGSKKNFEKFGKKIFAELKKNSGDFAREKLPDFLGSFLESEGVRSSRALSALADEFRSRVQESEEPSATATKSESSSGKDELQRIFAIADEEHRISALESYAATGDGNDGRSDLSLCLMALFSLYAKRENAQKMIATLGRAGQILGRSDQPAKTMRANIGSYLRKISRFMGRAEYQSYQELLETLSGVVDVEEHILEFKFYRLSLVEDTPNAVYRLLYFVRSGEWNSALSHYKTCGFSPEGSTEGEMRVFFEFAHFAAVNGSFRLAFDVLSQCRDGCYDAIISDRGDSTIDSRAVLCRCIETARNTGSNYKNILLYGLSVVLLPEIENSEIVSGFLDRVRELFNNPLILPFPDGENEIARALYLLNVFDYEEASRIIRKNCGFECEGVLKEKVRCFTIN